MARARSPESNGRGRLGALISHLLWELWDEWRGFLPQYVAIGLAIVAGLVAAFLVIDSTAGRSCSEVGANACKPHHHAKPEGPRRGHRR